MPCECHYEHVQQVGRFGFSEVSVITWNRRVSFLATELLGSALHSWKSFGQDRILSLYHKDGTESGHEFADGFFVKNYFDPV